MPTLQLLGPVDLRDDTGRELSQLLGQPKRFALLAYLAGSAPQIFDRRDRLFALFWPESNGRIELGHIGRHPAFVEGDLVSPATHNHVLAEVVSQLVQDLAKTMAGLIGGGFGPKEREETVAAVEYL